MKALEVSDSDPANDLARNNPRKPLAQQPVGKLVFDSASDFPTTTVTNGSTTNSMVFST